MAKASSGIFYNSLAGCAHPQISSVAPFAISAVFDIYEEGAIFAAVSDGCRDIPEVSGTLLETVDLSGILPLFLNSEGIKYDYPPLVLTNPTVARIIVSAVVNGATVLFEWYQTYNPTNPWPPSPPVTTTIYLVATTGTGLGTKLRVYRIDGMDLVPLPDYPGLDTANQFYGTTHINFHPNGQDFIAAGGQGPPFRCAWAFKIEDDGASISEKILTNCPTQVVMQTAWSPDGLHLVIPRGTNLSKSIFLYTFNGSYASVGQQETGAVGTMATYITNDFLVIGGFELAPTVLHIMQRSGLDYLAWDDLTTPEMKSFAGTTFEKNDDDTLLYYVPTNLSAAQWLEWTIDPPIDFQFNQVYGTPSGAAQAIGVCSKYICIGQGQTVGTAPSIVIYDAVTRGLVTDTLMSEQTWTSTTDDIQSCDWIQADDGLWYLAVSVYSSGAVAFIVFKETSDGVFEELNKPASVLTGQGNCVRFTSFSA